MVCELLLDRGDYILLEEYTYPSVIESVIIPKGYKALAVKLDQDGILPESLLEVQSSWYLLGCNAFYKCLGKAQTCNCSNRHTIF